MANPSGPERNEFGPCDESLAEDLARVGQRDISALRRIYDATAGQLLTVCLRVVGTREAAEDVLQDVFIKVWDRGGRYDRTRARPIAWLATIARNSAIDAHRAQARRKVEVLSDTHEIVDGSSPIDQELIDRQDRQQAMSMIDGLPAQQRDDLRVIYLEGLSYAELSDRNGEPVGTVKSRVRRALGVLKVRWNCD